jgi:hypothetical protein
MILRALRSGTALAATALLLMAGCGGDEPAEVTFNGGPTSLPAPPVPREPNLRLTEVPALDRAGAAVDGAIDRAAARADDAVRQADATVDVALRRVDATVERAERKADRAVGEAVDRARDATGRAADRVRRVGDALDSFSRGLGGDGPAPR